MIPGGQVFGTPSARVVFLPPGLASGATLRAPPSCSSRVDSTTTRQRRRRPALLALDAGGGRPIELHLESPDGTLETMFVLIDTADALRSTLRVLCRGEVGGSANTLGGVGIYQRKAAS